MFAAVVAVSIGLVIPAVPERFEFESKHMGTTFRIVLYADSMVTAEKASKAAFDRVAELDGIMSDYKSDSELMKLCLKNDREPGKPTVVSEDLFAVLQTAQDVAKRTDGSFDVTVGPVVRLWRIARRTQQMPEASELKEALAKVGYEKLILGEGRTVTLKLPGMRLDLGGIAKGFAADATLAVLRDKFNITKALVAASGDITCGDAPPGKTGWAVDIAPITKGREPRHLLLSHASVSTSGDLEQFVEIKGVRYSHVLDPKTGIGLTGRRSATVIAPKGVHADSLTKAASVLKPEKALDVIQSLDGAAMYVVVKETDDSPEVVTASKRFERFLAK